MSSRANEYPRAAKILAALGLTAQLAAAATNGIPVAQQITGVVARLVKSAEDIEKQRDALHELAETARKMGLSIVAVTAGRKLGEQVEHSLQGINIVCHAIEAVFAKHKAKHPMRKALSYAFTTSKDVEALSQELSRAAQQFELVATLDTNARLKEASALQEQANACLKEANARHEVANACLKEANALLQEANDRLQKMDTRVQENSPYNGNFRNLHDCDVDRLDLITEYAPPFSQYKITYYTAHIDYATCNVEEKRPVYVLRYLERKSPVTSDGKPEDDDYLVRSVLTCDRVLEQFSTTRDSHKNIARIYGRSQGDHFTNFTALKSGYIPISEVAPSAVSVERTWDMIVQIVDALCHLNDRGASWEPDGLDCVFLDHSGNPMIGLTNDLHLGVNTCKLLEVGALGDLLERGLETFWRTSHSDADGQHALAIRWGGAHFSRQQGTIRCSLPRRFIRTLHKRISVYLETALASCKSNHSVWDMTGPVVLRAAASNCKAGPAFYTEYFARSDHLRDHISMCRVEERDDELVHLTTGLEVPTSMKDEFRTKLGIPAPGPGVFFSTQDPNDPSSMSFRPWLSL